MFFGTQGPLLYSLTLYSSFGSFQTCFMGVILAIVPWAPSVDLKSLLILTLHVPFFKLNHLSIHSLFIHPVPQILTEHLLSASHCAEAPRTQKCQGLAVEKPNSKGDRSVNKYYKYCVVLLWLVQNRGMYTINVEKEKEWLNLPGRSVTMFRETEEICLQNQVPYRRLL